MREGWELKKLKEVCRFQNGFAFKSRTFRETGTPVVRITNIQAELVDLRKVVFIDRQDYDKDLSKYEIINGDLLIAMSGATTGKIGIHKSDEVLLLNQRVGKFEPLENLEKQYLFYFLSGKVEENLAISAGSAQPNLSTEQINNFEIPIPPLKEQKQIVALLDKAFTAIDQAKANIEKNIANAKELFQSKLNDIFSQKGAGWEEKTLNEICEVKDGTHDSPKYIDEEFGIPFVTQKNILDDGISFEKTKFISEEDHNNFYRRSNVAYNDILFAMIGANRGMACIVDDKRVFSIKNVGLIKSNESYRAKFILYFLKSPRAKKYVAENSSGSAQGFIGLTKLRAFPVPFTSIENQKEIELLIESLNNSIKATISNYTSKLNSLEELKKSILQKAFAGELTNQSAVGSNEFAVNIE